jgi:hypothetical protein
MKNLKPLLVTALITLAVIAIAARVPVIARLVFPRVQTA